MMKEIEDEEEIGKLLDAYSKAILSPDFFLLRIK